MPVSDASVAELRRWCKQSDKQCRMALERANSDLEDALSALIDAQLVELQDLDFDLVPGELIGRAAITRDIVNLDFNVRRFKDAGLPPDIYATPLRLLEAAKQDLSDPKKLARRGQRETKSARKDAEADKRKGPAAWKHPKLGRFTHDGDAWTAKVAAAGFDVFRYDAGPSKSRKYALRFETNDEDETPIDAAVAVALRVLKNSKPLAGKVAAALWDSFNGRGPKGMWWYGALDDVATAMEDTGEALQPPKRVEDFYRLMSLSQIVLRKARKGKPPLVELTFAAAFEEEHGVGVLTDGAEIVGIGYSADVRPFRKS